MLDVTITIPDFALGVIAGLVGLIMLLVLLTIFTGRA